MRQRYPQIILSAIFLLTGIFVMIKMYADWQDNELRISNPIVDTVSENTNGLDLKSIIHEAEKTVIQIEGQNEHQTITGSGFLYNDKGDIITNAHVIKDVDAIYVRTADAQFYPAAIIGISEETDIAVIRVPQLARLDVLPVATEMADIGDEVIALGSPHGFQNTVTLGIISGNERDFTVDGFDYSNAYQISAQITHGNSGGPLINRTTGEIIGINSVGTEDGTIGFSIPINEVIDQVEEWSNKAVNDQLEFANITDIINKENTDLASEDSLYLTEYFWDSIAIRDYVSAYSLLSSALQQEMPYSAFRNNYINIVELKSAEPTSEVLENNQIETTINIEFKNREKEEQKEKVTPRSFQFIFAHENDQLKIMSIQEISS